MQITIWSYLSKQILILAILITVLVGMLAPRDQAAMFIDGGGHSLRVLKIEGGGPAVVFENGYGLPLESWKLVQNSVKDFATTVAYDRGGVKRSEEGPLPRDGKQIAFELHTMLQNSGTPPPYILVGSSLGGLFIRIYAAMYPEEVSALILVDPSDDEEFEEGEWEGAGAPELDVWPITKRQARESVLPSNLPTYLIGATLAEESPYRMFLEEDESEAGEEELAFAILIEEKISHYRSWLSNQQNGKLVLTSKSRHLVFLDDPEIVVSTIREAIDLIGPEN